MPTLEYLGHSGSYLYQKKNICHLCTYCNSGMWANIYEIYKVFINLKVNLTSMHNPKCLWSHFFNNLQNFVCLYAARRHFKEIVILILWLYDPSLSPLPCPTSPSISFHIYLTPHLPFHLPLPFTSLLYLHSYHVSYLSLHPSHLFCLAFRTSYYRFP